MKLSILSGFEPICVDLCLITAPTSYLKRPFHLSS